MKTTMTKQVIFLLILIVSVQKISAQLRIRIEDASDRKPLANASIYDASGRLFIADQSGLIKLEKPAGKLVISYTGYYPAELNTDTIKMNEVIVLLRSSLLMNE